MRFLACFLFRRKKWAGPGMCLYAGGGGGVFLALLLSPSGTANNQSGPFAEESTQDSNL